METYLDALETGSTVALGERAKFFDQSTDMSWFWCLLFGPFWFLFIGSIKWTAISFLAAILTFGVSTLVMPFFARHAHREIAMKKALLLVTLDQDVLREILKAQVKIGRKPPTTSQSQQTTHVEKPTRRAAY